MKRVTILEAVTQLDIGYQMYESTQLDIESFSVLKYQYRVHRGTAQNMIGKRHRNLALF